MKTSAVAVNEEERLPSTALQVVDLGEDAGAGTEDMRSEELLTPMLRVLQKGSPEVDPSQPEYNENLRAGMLYNTATQEAYPGKTGIEMIVCARDYFYGMWIPRDLGGGFRGMMRADDAVVRQGLVRHGRFKKLPHTTEEGDQVELVETIQLYVLYAENGLTDQNAQRAILSFTSSALPVAQAYLTRHNTWRYRQPDGEARAAQLWSYRWNMTTVPMQNNKGSWFNPKLELVPAGARPIEALIPRDDPLFEMGRQFYLQQRQGEIKADYGNTGDDGPVPF